MKTNMAQELRPENQQRNAAYNINKRKSFKASEETYL